MVYVAILGLLGISAPLLISIYDLSKRMRRNHNDESSAWEVGNRRSELAPQFQSNGEGR